jgi:hypothetical protein
MQNTLHDILGGHGNSSFFKIHMRVSTSFVKGRFLMYYVFNPRLYYYINLSSHSADFLCVTVARSWFVPAYKAVKGAGSKAKTMTNYLFISTVLSFGF